MYWYHVIHDYLAWLLLCYNHACYIMLVIDQPFAGFLTNYFSTHIRWNFRIRVLKLIPSTLICEEKYQKISFHKVIQNWLFNMGARTKAFLFSFSSFYLYFFLSSFFYFLCFSFAFLGEQGEFILQKLRLKVPDEN